MSRATAKEREEFIAALLRQVPTATREHALKLLRWGTTYARLKVEECNGDWPIRRRDQAEWRKQLDAQTARAERIIRETCESMGGDPYGTLVTPHFQGDPRGHTVRLQIAGAPLDAYDRPALAVPTS